MRYFFAVIIIMMFMGLGYFFPDKKYLTCDGKIMKAVDEDSLESTDIISEDEKNIIEIFRTLEMLVFGTKDKTVKIPDQKILQIKNYFFGIKLTINDFNWNQCDSTDIEVVCKSDYGAHAFNFIQKKMMIDFYSDLSHTDTVQFGIYNCQESNNFF